MLLLSNLFLFFLIMHNNIFLIFMINDDFLSCFLGIFNYYCMLFMNDILRLLGNFID
jgi:hypothetical protein